METIPLDKWLAKQQDRLLEFAAYWRFNHYNDPNDFPWAIPEGDWEEQFAFFEEEV